MIENRRMAVLIVVAVVLISSAAGIVYAARGYSTGTSDIHKMSWGEILDVAEGTEVHVSMETDAYTAEWFDEVFAPLAKEWYAITLVLDESVTCEDIIDEWKADPNAKGSCDVLMGDPATLKSLVDVDGKGTNILYDGDWQSKLPRVKKSDNFADELWKFVYESIYGKDTYSRDVCSVAPFSGDALSFVYNVSFNDPSIQYNQVKVSKTSDGGATWKNYVINVSLSGADFDKDSIDTTEIYSLSSVRTVCRQSLDDSITCYYGLPHNFAELASWVELYPYQFFIPSATGSSDTYVQLLLESMIYELASANADGTEWTQCTDENAYVWSHDLKGKFDSEDPLKNKATYKEYIEPKIFSVKSDSEYGNAVPYLRSYLDQIMPYLNQEYTAYAGDIRDCNIDLIGNLVPAVDYDSSPSNTKVMLAFSLSDNMAMDSDPYTANVGMYMMETACVNRCGLFIPVNAPNPAGAIVICNLLNNPYVQATYYCASGNDFNMDMEEISEDQQHIFKAYNAEWAILDKPFVKIDNIAASHTSAPIGYRGELLSEYADPFIKRGA